MAYNNFAYFYDLLNGEADYDALAATILRFLHQYAIERGIVADLGCGTGELTLLLADAGYDMIGVDASADMLSVLREKMVEENRSDILLLQQDLAQLDLYGTIHAAVSTFDTLNHLGPAALARALQRVSLFLEPGGLFIFDMNTPYKHEQVLANQSFEIEADEAICHWTNTTDIKDRTTQISLQITEDGECVSEQFFEYYYNASDIIALCETCKFQLVTLLDGETFQELVPNSQRYLFVMQKQHEKDL